MNRCMTSSVAEAEYMKTEKSNMIKHEDLPKLKQKL